MSEDNTVHVDEVTVASEERVLPVTREPVSVDKPLEPAVSVPRTISSSSSTHATETLTVLGEANKLARAFKSSPLYPDISYTLHWTVPIRTGLIFLNINLLFLLMTYGGYSLLTLASYCALALLVVALAYSQGSILYARYVQGRTIENPLSQKWRVSQVSSSVLEKHMASLNNFVNTLIEVAMDVFLCNDPIFSLKVAALLYVYVLVGKWFDGITLLWIATVGVFASPRIYAEKKVEIDNLLALANDQINVYTALAVSKLPKIPLPAAPADKRKAL